MKPVRRTRDERRARRREVREYRRSEEGDTLVEVLLALIVLALASVSLLVAFGTVISASAEHRTITNYDTALETASQETIAAIQAMPSLFTSNCTTTGTPAPIIANYPGYTHPISLPSPYQNYNVQYASTNAIEFWNSTSDTFGTTCIANVPQLITLQVVGTNYQNSFVVNFPLGSTVATETAPSNETLSIINSPSVGSNGNAGLPLTFQPIVEVADAYGIVTTDLSPVVINVTGQSGATGAVSNCNGNELEGVVTFSGCTISASGTYTLYATDGNLTSNSVTVTVSGAGNQLVFTQQPVGGASGAALATQPIIKVENSSGVVQSSYSGSISLSSSGGILLGCDGLTPTNSVFTLTTTNGVFTLTGCTFQGGYKPAADGTFIATQYVLTASSATLIPTQSSSFGVSSYGGGTQLAFVQQPLGVATTSPANAVFTQQPIVALEDSFGNLVANQKNSAGATVGLVITLQSPEVTNGCGAPFANGLYTVYGCSAANSTYANNVVMLASGGGVTTAMSTPFNITGIPSQLVFTTQPIAGQSGSTLSTEPVLTVKDASGNVVTAVTSTLSLTSSDGTLSVCTNLVPVEGVISVSNCNFTGTVGTSYYLNASITWAGATVNATSTAIIPSGAGTATQLVFAPTLVAGASGSAFTTQPVIYVEDAAGNVVTTSYATISLNSSGGLLTGCSSLTAAGGVINVTGCVFTGVVGQSYNLIAVSAPLTAGTSANFSPSGPGPAAKLAFSVSPMAGASGSLFSIQPVVQVQDVSGNLVSTTNVTFTLTASGGTLTGCANLTTVSGSASVTGCTFSGLVGTPYVLTATPTTGSLSAAGSASFTPSGGGTPTQVLFTRSPTAGASGSVFTVQPILQLEDALGNLSNSATNTISLTASGGTLTGCTGLTASGGIVNVASCTFTGIVGTNYTLNATSTGLTGATSATFSPTGGGAPTKVVFTTSPTAGASGSAFSIQPVLQLQDALGNLSNTATNTISLTASGGTLTGCTNLTASGGIVNVANCTFSGLVGTNYTLNATSTGLTGATSATFSPAAAGTATKLVFSTSPTAGASGSNFTVQPVIYVEDAVGNVVTTSTATISLTASGGTLTGCTGLTASGGIVNVANCSFSGLVATNYTLSATSSGLATATSATFSPSSAGLATQLVFTRSPTAGASGSVFTVQPIIKVEDAAGNVVTTSTATISLTASGGTLTGCTGLTAVGGVANVANCSFAALLGTNYTLNATSSGLSTATSATFTPTGAGTETQISLVSGSCSPSVNFNSYCTVTAYAEDSAGNVITSDSTSHFTFTQTGGTGSVSGLTTVTTASGAASDTIQGTQAGSVILDVTGDTFTSNSVTITENKLYQTVSISNPPSKGWQYGPTYAVSTGSTYGLTVTLTLDATSTGCSLSGGSGTGTITFTGAGTCVIDANQPGNVDAYPAPQVQQSIPVVGFTQAAANEYQFPNAYSDSATFTSTSGEQYAVLIGYSASANTTSCSVPTGSALSGVTLVKSVEFGTASPYDYECVYSGTGTGTTNGTVVETITNGANYVATSTIQVIGIAGDNTATLTNSASNSGTSTSPVFKLAGTPLSTSVELLFGVTSAAAAPTVPAWSTTTPAGFTQMSLETNTLVSGLPSVNSVVYVGAAAASVTGSISISDPWGTVGLEIRL